MMLGVHAAVKRWNLERGLRRGREEGREEGLLEGREKGLVEGREQGRNERDESILKWLSEERAKGSEGFREDPPFLNNEHRD